MRSVEYSREEEEEEDEAVEREREREKVVGGESQAEN